MSRLVVTEFLSLDGVMEEPRWTAPYWNDEIAAVKNEELFAADAMLLGRVTYQGFAAAWPNSTDGDFAERMNALPKHVVSSTLRGLDWNNSVLLEGDLTEAVRQLKAQGQGDLLVHGSGQLVRALMAHGLVDLYRLLVYPVVLGSGQRLFGDGATARLTLTESRAFSSGVTMLCYQPDQHVPEPAITAG